MGAKTPATAIFLTYGFQCFCYMQSSRPLCASFSFLGYVPCHKLTGKIAERSRTESTNTVSTNFKQQCTRLGSWITVSWIRRSFPLSFYFGKSKYAFSVRRRRLHRGAQHIGAGVLHSPQVVDANDPALQIFSITAPFHRLPDVICKARKRRAPYHCEKVTASQPTAVFARILSEQSPAPNIIFG